MRNNALFILLSFSLFIGLDIGSSQLFDNIIAFNRKIVIDYIYLLLLLSVSSFSRWRLSVVVMLTFFVLVDIGHFYFFKSHLLPYEWRLIFVSFNDVANALSNSVDVVLKIVGLFVVIVIAFMQLPKSREYKVANYLLVLLLLLPFFSTKKITTFLPSNKHSIYFNTLFSFERNLYITLFKQSTKEFKPYKIVKNTKHKNIVMLVIGESLNYKYMNLYGSEFENTPLLNTLKKDKNFVYKKAISSATETTTSIASLLYYKREPQNISVLKNKNIIELAKANGYKTYWLSMQIDRGGIVPKFVNQSDISLIRENFKRKYDDALLSKLQSFELEDNSFIVIHLRANHYYYEDYTPTEFYKWDISDKSNYHNYMLKSYMNSVLYVDSLISGYIKYLKTLDKEFSFYFTSDHGERLGFENEEGKYFHIDLKKSVSYVPFIYYSSQRDREFTKRYYSHYDISKMVLEDIGFSLINENEKNNIYYINAPQFDGSAGYIKYDISKWEDR